MVGFLGILRHLLCCIEEEEEAEIFSREYHRIPDFVGRSTEEKQWKLPIASTSQFGSIRQPQASQLPKSSASVQTEKKANTLSPPEPRHNSHSPISTAPLVPCFDPDSLPFKIPVVIPKSLLFSPPPPPPPSLSIPNKISKGPDLKPKLNITFSAKPQEKPQSPRIFASSTAVQSFSHRSSIEKGVPVEHMASSNQEPSKISWTKPKEEFPKRSLAFPEHHEHVKGFKVKPQELPQSRRNTAALPVNQGNSAEEKSPKQYGQNQNPSPKPSPSMKYVQKSSEKKTQVSTKTSPIHVPRTKETDPFASCKPLPLSLAQPSSSSLPTASKKTNYFWVQKGTTSLYSVPEDLKEFFEKDIVPHVLRNRLTPLNYKNYFAALLYAEDFYCEKWSNYCLQNVTLELHEAAIYAKHSKNKCLSETDRDGKIFVAFRIDSVPERRPFLLSRDFVLLQPSGEAVEPFRGILYRVVKSNLVLAEFGDEFYVQHTSKCKYDVSFSFNRVCLKRCHQAVAATTGILFDNFLFPSQKSRTSWINLPPTVPFRRNLSQKQLSAVYNILRLKGCPPFLIEGPLCTERNLSETRFGREMKLSVTGRIIQEAVLQIYRTSTSCRILINAPTNRICDFLARSLMEEIPESKIFRANAAFREIDGVPGDILPLCPFEGECFTCPPLQELLEFRLVLSTYISSFRLHSEGISCGHFSHIFLVDASSTMEPETIVPLANLVDEKRVVIVTGAVGNCSGWIRSDIARKCGLKISYFQRLFESEPYRSLDPKFVACLGE